MRYELKSIGIWSFLKVAFFANGVLGFLFGLMYVPFIVLISKGMFSNMGISEMIDNDIVGEGILFLVIFTPIVFAIIGAVFYTLFGLICMIIYNLFSKFLGGVEFNLESVNGTALQVSLPDDKSQPVGNTTTVLPKTISPIPPPPPPPFPAKEIAPIAPASDINEEATKDKNPSNDDSQDNSQL